MSNTDPQTALANAFPASKIENFNYGCMAIIPDGTVWLDRSNDNLWHAELYIDYCTPIRAWGSTIDEAMATLVVNARAQSEVQEMEAFEQYQRAKEARECVAKLFP